MINQMVISGHRNVWKSVMSGSKEVMGMVSMQNHALKLHLLEVHPMPLIKFHFEMIMLFIYSYTNLF